MARLVILLALGLALALLLPGAEGLASDSVCKTSSSSSSEVVGAGPCAGDIFLKGNYVEVGIHKVASYGTQYNAPSSSEYSSRRLGFIADFDKNGWDTSSPGFAGDYFVPGAPVEGW